MTQENSNWFHLTFEEKSYESHKEILFPDKIDKNRMDFLSMIIQRLIYKTSGMTDDELDKFLGFDQSILIINSFFLSFFEFQ